MSYCNELISGCTCLLEFRAIPIIPVVYRQSWVLALLGSSRCSRRQWVWWKR